MGRWAGSMPPNQGTNALYSIVCRLLSRWKEWLRNVCAPLFMALVSDGGAKYMSNMSKILSLCRIVDCDKTPIPMGGMCTCGQAHSAECDGEYQIVQCACGRVVVLLPADEERALADALRRLPQPPGG